jgi:hypothetical protein
LALAPCDRPWANPHGGGAAAILSWEFGIGTVPTLDQPRVGGQGAGGVRGTAVF